VINPFTKKEIPKRKYLIKFFKWRRLKGRGQSWIGFVEEYVNWKTIVLYGGMVKLNFPWIAWWMIVVGMMGISLVMEIIRWKIGKWDFDHGITEIEGEWNSKTSKVNITQVEQIKTLKAICKKLGIKDHFTDLHREKEERSYDTEK